MRTLAALLLIAHAALAQPSSSKACSLSGSVINSVTRAAVARARVSIANADDTLLAESDASGRWSVAHLACGVMTVTAARVGFLRNQPAAPAPPELTLVEGAPAPDVQLELIPQAVIAGKVVDEQGDPMAGAIVSLMTSRVLNGLRSLAASISTTTNDLGEYRIAGLAAGKYVVCATVNQIGPANTAGLPPYGEKCYPGPVDAAPAITMDVPAGYEGRVDMSLAPLSAVQVRGMVSGVPEGANATVSLVSASLPALAGRMGMFLSAPVRKDGTFAVKNVPPGSYILSTNALQQNRRLMARAQVEVAANDVDGLQLRVEPGATVTGSVKIVSTTGKTFTRPQFNLSLRSAEMGVAQVVWDETRTAFAMPDVVPGVYRLEFSAPAPLYLKSAAMGGRDAVGTDVVIGPGGGPLEIAVTDDGGVVEGDVTVDDRSATAWVLLQQDSGPVRNTRTDSKGHFRLDTIPPGRYKIYAWDNSTGVEYANPEWMTRNAKGVDVTVQAAQTQQVKLVRQTAPLD